MFNRNLDRALADQGPSAEEAAEETRALEELEMARRAMLVAIAERLH